MSLDKDILLGANTSSQPTVAPQQAQATPTPTERTMLPGSFGVIKRNGHLLSFDAEKIRIALVKAFVATEGTAAPASQRIDQLSKDLTQKIIAVFASRMPSGGAINIEEIQDQVELALMRDAHQQVARNYVLYREQQRIKRKQQPSNGVVNGATISHSEAPQQPTDTLRLHARVKEACASFANVDVDVIVNAARNNMYEGIAEDEVQTALIIAARALVEQEINYSYVTAQLLMQKLRQETCIYFDLDPTQPYAVLYQQLLPRYIDKGIELDLLNPQLKDLFDHTMLIQALKPERDLQFNYLGLQTLYDRYFLHTEGVHLEWPQIFFMRVAMGLALREEKPTERAIEFYNLLSQFDYMTSTPTLFNSGTKFPQLSSCYLTTMPDNLLGIFSGISDNAQLSKWSGGLGNDWTPVRGLGAHIKGTNGKSQGIVPFLKVVNDTAVAVNQGGKRRGAICSYLETWHLDIEEFIELRKNTGDDRRRTHDMHTAHWIPDLFMKRVQDNANWTLFSPNEAGDLHDLYGKEFEQRYMHYEQLAQEGKIKNFKQLSANNLWRQMVNMLFETGHPWLTFKDPCNVRSPQRHCGVVHSSNLCTEITLNTKETVIDENGAINNDNAEIAVCNLGSVNLANHLKEDGSLDLEKLERTITVAIRMLDNVIDINYYSVVQAKHSNLKHRPIGLGLMGFQDALYKNKISYNSEAAVSFADRSMEAISYFAIQASVALAKERGSYESYQGSLWSQGILPIDSIELLREQRGGDNLTMNTERSMDWDTLRETVKKDGMRNSNVMAIAPTATISNIIGVNASIEPAFANLYTKSNLSGEFTVVNPYLVQTLKEHNLWDAAMINDIKCYEGSIAAIKRVPEEVRERFATAFEINIKFMVEAASRRQKWIDQAQSLNIYIPHTDGKAISDLYHAIWRSGLKTTYYLRTKSATQTEMASTTHNHNNAAIGAVANESNTNGASTPQACAIEDPDCEACQ